MNAKAEICSPALAQTQGDSGTGVSRNGPVPLRVGMCVINGYIYTCAHVKD